MPELTETCVSVMRDCAPEGPLVVSAGAAVDEMSGSTP
jgi:hypothetical protein